MGRTSILLVIAFNLMFMMVGFRLSSITSSAYDKYTAYYSIEQASLAAESGANIVISNAFFAKATPMNYTFSSGTGINGTITLSKTANKGISGDTLGFNVTSTSRDDKSTVITHVTVQGASFSQFGMFTQSEQGITWQGGDTCFGPYHTQDNITCSGTPRFYGPVTTNGKVTGGSPYFKYPVTPNTNIPLDGTLADLTLYGQSGGAYYSGVKVFVQFNSNGSITVRTELANATVDGWVNVPADPDIVVGSTHFKACTTYANVNALTSNGVLLVDGSELHVKGVMGDASGNNPVKITLGAINTGSIVMIDSSLVYNPATPPPCSRNQHPAVPCNDMLGIVSQNQIFITDTQHPYSVSHSAGEGGNKNYATANNNNAGNVEVDATMYSSTQGFGAENHGTRGNNGTLRVVGGIQEQNRVTVGTTSGQGFDKSYDYDLNLQYSSPKGYPSTRFLIQNWVDSTIVNDQAFWNGENIMNITH